MNTVQMLNQQMILNQSYNSLKSNPDLFQSSNSNFRYNLVGHDYQTLHRKYCQERLGFDSTRAPQYNLDDWLNKDSPHYRMDLATAIFFYSARTQRNEKLKVCISTPDMDRASWKYAHGRQILLDGTFGVVSSRMLLFIAMGVDEHGKGIPLAFFLFSAPAGSQATHAGYDTEILRELLQSWVSHLGQEGGKAFAPVVAITDTDTKERSALLQVWPGIWLILCKFHVRQCWTSKKRQLFRGASFWNYHFRCRMKLLEDK